MGFEKGEVVSGVVSGVVDYGVFVRLDSGGTGMIHISKLSTGYVSDIYGFIKVGTPVTATVVSCDGDRIGLSLVGDVPKRPTAEKPKKDFEAMLAGFLSRSEQHRQQSGDQRRCRRRRREK